MAGPLEYLIVGFPDNDFTGEIAAELAALVDAGTIDIVDLVFIARGDEGDIVVLEIDEHAHLSAFAALDAGVGGVIGPDDIEHAAVSIAEGSSVLLMVWEDRWAQPLVGAMRRAGGQLIEGARIPEELAQELDSVLAETN